MNQVLRLDTARLWRKHPREIVAAGLLGLAGSMALASSAWSTPTVENLPGRSAADATTPPAPPPLLVRELAPEDALAMNRAIPIADGPNPAAKPFSLGKAAEATRSLALECLTSAVYYEAGSETADGQKAVAQVVLNRVRHPAFPDSVCGVVYEGASRATGCQFTFTCDGSMTRRPTTALWDRARKIAWAALTGTVYEPVGNATHYHAEYVVPYWASSLTKNAVVGAHIFYRWAGGWGRPQAFTERYAQQEPDARALRMAAAETEQQRQAEVAAAEIPGAEVIAETTPGKEGKRVSIRLNLKAREAVEAAPHIPYVEKVAASENLRWTLSGGGVDAQEDRPFGRPKTAIESKDVPAVSGGAGGAAPN